VSIDSIHSLNVCGKHDPNISGEFYVSDALSHGVGEEEMCSN
jgi:hypothetical protein